MALTLTFNQPGIPAGDLDRGRTDILTTDAGGGRAPVVTIDIGDVPAGSVVLVQAIDEPPASSPLLTQVSDTHWTLEFNAGAWGPFRIQATASIGTEVVSSVTRRISVRSPTFHLAYPALSERYDPNAHLVPTVPSVQLTEMNEHSTNRALVDFHREVVQAIDTLSAGGIDSIPDGSITEAKLDPALVAQLVLTDGSHAMVGELDMSGSRIVDVGQPTLPTDAARLADADYTAGAGLVRTGQTLDVVAHADGSIVVAADSVQVGVLASDAQHGTRGGAALHATVTPSSAGFASAADKTKLDGIAPGADVTLAALAAAAVPVSVNGQRITNLGAPIVATDAVRAQDLTAAAVVAGAGLVRAGTTLDVVAHADGSIVVAADSVQVGVLATDAQHGTHGGAALHAIVTPTVAGFASAADKTKLNTIATGADVTLAALAAAAAPVSVNGQRVTSLGTPTAPTDAATKAYVDAAPPVPHASTHADGGSDELNVAGLSGLLADPQTAGGIKTATTTVAVAAAAAPAADQALMATSSTAAAWRVPPVATTSLPGYLSAADKLKLDGVATSAAAVGSSAASQVTVTTAAAGAAVTAARSDHVHSVATGAPSGLTVGGVQAAGTSTSLVRQDHVHAMPALVTTTVDGFMSAADKTRLDGMATAAAAVGSTAASQITVATAASGAATTAARSDHVHSVATAAPSALTVGAAQAAGTSTSLARADHVHAMPAAATPVALTLAGANAAGAAATLALSDHVHALPATAAPAALTVGGSSSAGVAVTLPRSDHVHAMPALVTTTVDGFMSAADKSKLDGVEAGAQVTTFARVQTALAAASSAVSINAQRLTSVADPSSAQDAATKAYVDAVAQGLDAKASVRLVATTNVATLSGAVTIDGVTTAADRVLLTAQTTASANGLYLTNAGGAWARTTDADTSAKVTSGMYVFATEGSANADSGWALITPDPIVLGTTALTFTQVTGAGQITAGAGLTKSGNTLNVVPHADGSIAVAADTVQVGVLATDAQHGTRGGGTLHATVVAAGAAGFMSGADKTKLDGVATGAAALASTSPANVGTTAAVGVGTTAARSDHVHAHGAQTDGTLHAVATTSTAGFLSATDKAKLDGVAAGAPALSSTAPANVANAAAVGVGTTAARADHVHAHGLVTVGSHQDATSGASGFMPGADKGAMDVITTGSTVRVNARLATATTLPAYTATTISTNKPRLTANANGALTVDGVAAAVGDLVLVLFEAVANCGLFQVVAAGGASIGWQLDLVLSGAYDGNYVGLLNGSTLVICTSPAGFAYCNREFRAASATSGLFVELPGPMQIWPRDQTPPTTIYPGWQYELDMLAGTSPNLTLVSPVGSEQVLRGVQFGVTVGLEGTNAITITPTALSHIQGPYSQVTNGDPSATFSLDSGGAVTWVCGRGYTSYNPDCPSWRVLSGAGLLAPGLVCLSTNARVAYSGNAPAAGSAFIATGPTAAAFTAPGLPAALPVAAAQAAGSSNAHARADHVHAMPGLATTSADGFLSAADKTRLGRAPKLNQCRLSGDATSPIMLADNAAISTLYLLPYVGDVVYLFVTAEGSWVPFNIPTAGISLALTGMTTGRPYDVYCAAPSTIGGTPTLEILAWTSTTARATALVDQGGIFTKSGDQTRRYVGTIYARSASTISWVRNGYDTATAKCDLWNADNRAPAVFTNLTTWTGSITVSTANAWFQVATSYKTEFIVGRVVAPLHSVFNLGCCSNGTANAGYAGVALNASSPTNGSPRVSNNAADVTPLNAVSYATPALGYNTLQFMALGTATAVVFFTTDDPAGTPPVYQFDCFTRLEY